MRIRSTLAAVLAFTALLTVVVLLLLAEQGMAVG